jgi:hypothetical protein
MDSTNVYDICGECGGKNFSCNYLKGRVEVLTFKSGNYEPLIILPINASNIKINKRSTKYELNFLAIRDLEG